MSTRSPAEIHILQNEAAKRANADPLPGSVGDAFAKYGPIEVGELSVRQVVASDWRVLRSLDSPIIKMLMELRQNPEHPAVIEISEEEDFAIALQFTRPPKEIREIVAKGKEHFLKVAQEEIGDKLSTQVIQLIEAAVIEQIKRSWATAISYQQKMEEKEQTSFFPQAGKTPETV